MSIIQKSSRARDRELYLWFHFIQQGQVKLPRFQRHEAWDRGRITSFLNTIINNLPVGVALVLEVDGEEKFVSRYIYSADSKAPQGKVTEHLLDGQQRLTTFWRAMHNNYETDDYFIYLPEFDCYKLNWADKIEVRRQKRWLAKNGSCHPLWADNPTECLKRGLFPINLLCPGNENTSIKKWVRESTQDLNPDKEDPEVLEKYKDYVEIQERLKERIDNLRNQVANFNLPYLSLPSNTSKDVALQVFINMNTHSKPLSLYDIIVAQVESVADKSLHDLVESLDAEYPKVARFGAIRSLVLTTSALIQEKTPDISGMIQMDKRLLLNNWKRMERGLGRMAELLESQGIFDKARLPTNAVLAVIAAAYDLIPEHGDFVAKAEKLLRAYLWSSFFTDRYEGAAATHAYADFKGGGDNHRGIKDFLSNPGFAENEIVEIPVLNREAYKLADINVLMDAGWPKKVGIKARGILAVSSYFGAHDFADSKKASYSSVQKREYHHIFPKVLLSESGIDSDYALNCVLITWKTNRIIGRKDPIEYLKKRVEWADEVTVSDRLKTHLVSYELLSKAQYQELNGETLKSKLEVDLKQFMRNRAQLVHQAVKRLVSGEQPSLDSIWASCGKGVITQNSKD